MSFNGTMINFNNNSTTTLTFTAPSLPDGVFTGTVVVMVSAVTINGIGIASEPAIATIIGKICMYVHIIITFENPV